MTEAVDVVEEVRPRGASAVLRDYLSLTKPRVAALLLLTALVPMVLAAEGLPSPRQIGLTMLGGYLAAGGAGAVNCYLDRDIDRRMARTCHRALPSGRLEPWRALILGIGLGLLAGLILWLGTHPLAAVLALAAFLHYVFIYTLWLKRRSPSSVVIGGAAGAIPPLVGWAAVSGTLSPTALVLSAIVFCWTPAHFWALALMRQSEYAAVGIPMLPVVHGRRITRRRIVAYVAVTALLTALPVINGTLGLGYAAATILLDAWLLYQALRMLQRAEAKTTRRFYFSTLFYLGTLFLSMVLEKLLS